MRLRRRIPLQTQRLLLIRSDLSAWIIRPRYQAEPSWEASRGKSSMFCLRAANTEMKRKVLVSVALAGIAMFFGSAGWADVPAPPVNQVIGMDDIALGALSEADCRVCHDSGVPDRHHLLYGQPIPTDSLVPYPDADGDGNPDSIYGCLNCHDENFTVVGDCTVCHIGASPHHTRPSPTPRDCVACHGDLVDNFNDGHYIPSYSPSLVTPTPSDGDGLPANSRGTLAGGCNYCHDDDGLATPVILTNDTLHHNTGLPQCAWCHDIHEPPEERIRTCEECHGPDSLHNIQGDSPAPGNIGTIVVGGEDAGYGHVGRDAGPGDSDCWGCHGFATPVAAVAYAPGSGPIIPTVYSSDLKAIVGGIDTAVTLTGSSFTNVAAGTQYTSDVALTAADGSSSVILTPDLVDQGTLGVTIPGDTPAGNYKLQAVKGDFASNPAVISIKPEVIITEVTGNRTVTISGSGFGGYAPGSGTSVTGTVTTGRSKRKTATTVEASIVSWSDTTIEAEFGSRPIEVTVNSVFGSAASEVGKDKKPKHRAPNG